jgi:protoheme IX farnesyltransferase
MNVKSIAGQPGERRARVASSSDSAHLLDDHWSVSDVVALTKPRVMMLAVFTALVGLSRAPVRRARTNDQVVTCLSKRGNNTNANISC